MSKSEIKPVKLIWEKKTPLSTQHEDFYFSLKDGLEETEYVFLKANKLPYQFTQGDLKSPFIISETGFGTGLNFLATWDAWLQIPDKKRPLHFISIEKYPLTKADLKQCLDCWPQLEHISSQLIDCYPYLINGQHQIHFESGQVCLTLIFGDVNSVLSNYRFKSDCWFLDGFSPSKNPSMWTDHLFSLIAEYSHPKTTISTFTAASIVRRGLEKAGFDVTKPPGFGAKREMITAKLSNKIPSDLNVGLKNSKFNWSIPKPIEKNEHRDKIKTDFDAIVIGAGLAGISTAAALAESGLSVALVEEKPTPVSGASGQSQLAMYAKFPTEENKLYHFIAHCLSYSQRYYTQLQLKELTHSFWYQTGLLQLAWNLKESTKQLKFIQNTSLPSEFIRQVSTVEASELSKLNTECGGLWFEKAGWLDPKNYAQSLLINTKITQIYDTNITHLTQQVNSEVWTCYTKDSSFTAKHVVVANSNKAKTFEQLSHLPTKPLRGQVTSIKQSDLNPANCVVCGEGYLCPKVGSWHHFGATFDLDSNEDNIKENDNQKNIDSLQKWFPGWLSNIQASSGEMKSSAGLRCTTPDYLPIVGKAPIYDVMLQAFSKLRVGANSCKHLYGHYYTNLFVNTGHGSKGLFTTPLAAAYIRSEICGGIPPFSEEQKAMISPSRFIIKHLKQRRI